MSLWTKIGLLLYKQVSVEQPNHQSGHRREHAAQNYGN